MYIPFPKIPKKREVFYDYPQKSPYAPSAPRRGIEHIAQGAAMGYVLLAFQAVCRVIADNHFCG